MRAVGCQSSTSGKGSDLGRADHGKQKYKQLYRQERLEKDRCLEELARKEATIKSTEAQLREQERKTRELTEQSRRLTVSRADLQYRKGAGIAWWPMALSREWRGDQKPDPGGDHCYVGCLGLSKFGGNEPPSSKPWKLKGSEKKMNSSIQVFESCREN